MNSHDGSFDGGSYRISLMTTSVFLAGLLAASRVLWAEAYHSFDPCGNA